MIIGLFMLALIFFILTLLSTKKDKSNFTNGILLSTSIFLCVLAIYIQFTKLELVDAAILLIEHIIKYVTYIIASLFIYNGIYNSLNTKRVRKNNLTDLFSFLSGISLIMINILIENNTGVIFIMINAIMLYINIMFISYVLNSLIYKIMTKIKKYDVIIVLGAGLINGTRPCRTLVNRLNRAIEIYNIDNNKPYIIVSGGKGSDEKISEAEAMKNYLIEKGIEENKIILEEQSTNTYENFKYSKEKLKDIEDNDMKIAFVSSDFHIYRASLYAKQVGLDIDAIECKSLFHYYPNAFIREFAAIFITLFIKKKERHK